MAHPAARFPKYKGHFMQDSGEVKGSFELCKRSVRV